MLESLRYSMERCCSSWLGLRDWLSDCNTCIMGGGGGWGRGEWGGRKGVGGGQGGVQVGEGGGEIKRECDGAGSTSCVTLS